MAYIAVPQLRASLPESGAGLTDQDIERIVAERIEMAQAENSTETAYSRAYVARGAYADALVRMYGKDGATAELGLTRDMRQELQEYKQAHDKMGSAPGEPDGRFDPSSFPAVSNLTDAPLWGEEEFA